MRQSFTLVPFGEAIVPVALTVDVVRQGDRINLRYGMTGDLAAVAIPSSTAGNRMDCLWEHTCFEFFLGVPGEANYWEVNLSPSGDWNCYRLMGYREGLLAESRVERVLFQVLQVKQALCLEANFELLSLGLTGPVELSVTAVVEAADGAVGYWAIAHCGEAADFHLRDSFVVRL